MSFLPAASFVKKSIDGAAAEAEAVADFPDDEDEETLLCSATSRYAFSSSDYSLPTCLSNFVDASTLGSNAAAIQKSELSL